MKIFPLSVFSLLALGACSSSSSTILPAVDSGNPSDSATQDSTVADSGGMDTSMPGNDAPTSSDAPMAADTSITDAGPGQNDAELAHCGQPGDKGNSLGVGKYCQSIGDCTGLTANLCSTLGGPGTNFCTFLCTPSDASSMCGDNATCACQGGQCGCLPNYCL